jgi:hypothetical protein
MCKSFKKYLTVKNPGISTDFKQPVKMEIFGSKMRASQGKRGCMIVLTQWFQKYVLQIPRIHGYISVMTTFKFTYCLQLKGKCFVKNNEELL